MPAVEETQLIPGLKAEVRPTEALEGVLLWREVGGEIERALTPRLAEPQSRS